MNYYALLFLLLPFVPYSIVWVATQYDQKVRIRHAAITKKWVAAYDNRTITGQIIDEYSRSLANMRRHNTWFGRDPWNC